MKVIALISGGKDSIYTLCKLKDEGHHIVACVYMHNKSNYVDSYMFQTVGREFIDFIQKVLDIPFVIRETKCYAKNQNLEYEACEYDEVEDLFTAVKSAFEEYGGEAICSGAIESTYQKNRVGNIAKRLNLLSLSPLWKHEQKELLKEMIDYGINAVIVKIASPLLPDYLLGKDISELYAYLITVKTKWDLNFCGEGGEYETIVVNCKHFNNKICFKDIKKVVHPEDIYKNKTEQVMFCCFTDIFLDSTKK
ncbi:Dph6 [Ecytonucleospora hepatopenaei]|uniref:Diphthine--ammonia ligase n=1 Tax=Ecytonucleospora hepatopenaei TaxID=646526 RepID=A0A1W0E5L3_9MICR|nr:Dph6 [Ecytonucleospora hepatopenaei]